MALKITLHKMATFATTEGMATARSISETQRRSQSSMASPVSHILGQARPSSPTTNVGIQDPISSSSSSPTPTGDATLDALVQLEQHYGIVEEAAGMTIPERRARVRVLQQSRRREDDERWERRRSIRNIERVALRSQTDDQEHSDEESQLTTGSTRDRVEALEHTVADVQTSIGRIESMLEKLLRPRAEAEHTDEKQALPEDPRQATAAASGEGIGEAGSSSNAEAGGPTIRTSELAEALPSALSGATLLAAQNAEAARQGASSSSAASTSKLGQDGEEEEEDLDDVTILEGTECKRTGCGAKYDGRERDRSQESCRYHPKSAIFREGSKGYACCKRRVLEFSEFLTIEPCTTSKKGHLFAGQPKAASGEDEEPVDCRLDHYETPVDIRLTVYAKGADMDKSRVDMRSDEVQFSVWLPPATPSASRPRRFRRTLRLFSDIDPAASSMTSTKFKIDLVLVKKAAGVSWPSLERSERVFGYGLTFGRHSDVLAKSTLSASKS